MKTDLKNKVVVITGASGGIGSAIARQFASEGAKLVLHYRQNKAAAEALQRGLNGTESMILKADLTRETEVARLFSQAVKRFTRVDTLIANAGSWENRDAESRRRWRCRRSLGRKIWRERLSSCLQIRWRGIFRDRRWL